MDYDLLGDINITWLLFAMFILWEHLSPNKSLETIKQRWIVNFSLLFISFIILTALNTGLSEVLITKEQSPFNFATLDSKQIFAIIGVLLFLDLFSYLLHRLFHFYQVLWRCHSVHHSDLNIDLSTNFRHHPLETIVNWVLTSMLVWLLGIDLIVLVIFASISFPIQMWQHSNIKINTKIDTYLSYVVITPQVHRVHHSSNKVQTNSNYGNIFTIWDRIFGTFTNPNELQAPLVYGLEYFQMSSQQSFFDVFKQPFRQYTK